MLDRIVAMNRSGTTGPVRQRLGLRALLRRLMTRTMGTRATPLNNHAPPEKRQSTVAVQNLAEHEQFLGRAGMRIPRTESSRLEFFEL